MASEWFYNVDWKKTANWFPFRVFLIALVLLGLAEGRARAQQVLYGVITTAGSPAQLITINTTTWTLTGGPSLPPATKPSGLAFRGNNLYTWDDTSKRIQQIDPNTGAVILSINIGLVTGGSIAFRSDGIGFLAQGLPINQLVRFDITVPSSTVVGPLTPTLQGQGVAFDPTDTLFELGSNFPVNTGLYTLNQVTGAGTLVGLAGIPINTGNSIAFDASGKLVGGVTVFGGNSSMYTINPGTGISTPVGGSFGGNLTGLAFQPLLPPGVTITESGGSTNVTEGGTTDTYTVVLNTKPTANVTITINPGLQVTVVPAVLTFTPANWNVPQTVTVTAVNHFGTVGPHLGIISHTAASADAAYNGIAIATVTANVFAVLIGPPPPPPRPYGGGEGSFGGSSGPGGDEGSFGSGGRTVSVRTHNNRIPALSGPFMEIPSSWKVFNVSHRQKTQPDEQQTSDENRNVLGWAIVVTLLVGLTAVLVVGKKIRLLFG